MKKKIDIVIRYEHKVRELESIMLIKLEMERRGYTVAFTANYDYKDKNQYDPKLIVSPAIYWDGTLGTDLTIYGLKKKIANLLWEQVMGIEEEESPTGPHNITGTGQKIVTFCWGKRTQDRLVSAGMPKEHTKVVGQINTDLLREPFCKLLMTKERLASQFNLDVKAPWYLFVSSFAYCELDDLQKELVIKVYGEKYLKEFTEASNKSRELILEWFDTVLKKHPERIIIYRPHPDEAKKSTVLKEMESKYPNFRVLSDYSLKHWINASDKIYNWYSTGIIDAIVLNKPNRILRPCVVPKGYDYRLFYEADQIKTIAAFEEDYTSLEVTPVFSSSLIEEYYHIPDSFVYIHICDILEDILVSSKYDINYSPKEIIRFGIPYMKVKLIKSVSIIKPFLKRLHLFDDSFKKSEEARKVLESGYEKNVATEIEINSLYEQLKPLVYGE